MQAWLVVLGAVVALVSGVLSEFVRDWITRKRQRRDNLEAFQREHLLLLQDGMLHLLDLAYTSLQERQRAQQQTSAWPLDWELDRVVIGETSVLTTTNRVLKHLVLVHDDQVRAEAETFLDRATDVLNARTEVNAIAQWGTAWPAFKRANDRIGVVLRAL